MSRGPEITGTDIWLKSTWSLDGRSNYYYSSDGKSFTYFDKTYQMMWGSYRGDRIAIFNYNNKADDGYIDVDFFHYSFSKFK